MTEELVMDVFFALWQQRGALDSTINLVGWLHSTLRNKALHELRARAIREKHLVFLAMSQSVTEVTPEEKLDAQLLEKRIELAIGRLSPQCREAFTLSRYEHLSYNDIAARMGISVKTVEKHIGKAIGLLRKDFKGYQLSISLLLGLLELALSHSAIISSGQIQQSIQCHIYP